MNTRKQYEQEVKARFVELEEEIDKLREKVKQSEQELFPEHRKRMDELRALRDKLKIRYHELLEAGDDAWDDVQKGVEHYWDAVGRELKAFENFFEKPK